MQHKKANILAGVTMLFYRWYIRLSVIPLFILSLWREDRT